MNDSILVCGEGKGTTMAGSMEHAKACFVNPKNKAFQNKNKTLLPKYKAVIFFNFSFFFWV